MAFIISESCIGCSSCVKVCPAGAISGTAKHLHHIDPGLCLECGACGRVCPKGSVKNNYGNTIKRLKKSLWLKPVINRDNCYACENCVAVCPSGALTMKAEDLPLVKNYAVLSFPDKCVSCGWCVDNCQFNAIVLEASDEDN